ncbi:MAG: ribonuclease R [Candidatus Izimaplasma sp.]|nr:ribonuclease R [Candidatus Izimaplasma bacterium]
MRKKLLDLFNKSPKEKLKIKDIKQQLSLSTSEEFTAMMKSLNELVDEAKLIENNNHEFTLIEHTNYVVGRLDLKEKGFGFVIPENPKLNDVFIPPKETNDAMNDDIVLVHIQKQNDWSNDEGVVKRIIKRNNTHVLGIYKYRDGHGTLLPDDKTIKTEIFIRKENSKKAKKNDKVNCKIVNYDFKGKLECEVTEVLGNMHDKGVDVLSKIIKYEVRNSFSEELLSEAKNITQKAYDTDHRKDLRDELFITIDGDDAKDFDDAVLVKLLPNDNYKLYVSIADVSYYVEENSLLDEEAYDRGTSIYLPNGVIPMLPEIISNGECSLVPNEDRLTQTCEMEITKSGKVKDYKIYPSIINSKYRMTYTKVNKIFEGDKKLNDTYVEIIGMLYNMRNLAKSLKKRRDQLGSINFDSKESYIKLNDNGKAVDVGPRTRGISERIIEDFMLTANKVVAEHVHWLNLPFIYRVHEDPSKEKIHKLLKMTGALGFDVKAKNEISNKELQKLLDKVEGTDAEKGVNLLVLRSMQKAIYSEQNLGHFGLNFKFYTHFTSPIRRYPDLMVHRLLRKYLYKQNKSTKTIEHYKDIMPDVAKQASKTERNAVLLEREVVDMKKAEYITRYINKQYDGVITSVTNFGLYVTLPNTVEGLVHIKELRDDYYNFDPDLMLLVGEHKKNVYKVGDHVRVQVMKTNIQAGEIDFKIVRR